MGLSFGRRNVEDVDDAPRSLNRRLMREIASAGDKGLTCSVEAVAPKGGGSARFYLYEGGVYAVRLDGYAPRVMDRMRASGDLDAAAGSGWWTRWATTAPIRGPGVTAVEEDWISEDTLAILHREYVVACAGAVLVLPKVRLHLHKGDVTSDYCSLPLEPARLFRVVEGRTRRLNAEWEALSRTGTPSTVSLSRTAQPLPDKLSSPEFSAMLSVIDSTRSVDAVAEEFGMTRFEAVHAATLLAEAGVVVAHADAGVHVPSDRLMVPEHFGAHVDPTSARARTGGAAQRRRRHRSRPMPGSPSPSARLRRRSPWSPLRCRSPRPRSSAPSGWRARRSGPRSRCRRRWRPASSSGRRRRQPSGCWPRRARRRWPSRRRTRRSASARPPRPRSACARRRTPTSASRPQPSWRSSSVPCARARPARSSCASACGRRRTVQGRGRRYQGSGGAAAAGMRPSVGHTTPGCVGREVVRMRDEEIGLQFFTKDPLPLSGRPSIFSHVDQDLLFDRFDDVDEDDLEARSSPTRWPMSRTRPPGRSPSGCASWPTSPLSRRSDSAAEEGELEEAAHVATPASSPSGAIARTPMAVEGRLGRDRIARRAFILGGPRALDSLAAEGG